MFARRLIHHGVGGSNGGGYVPSNPTASISPGSVTFDAYTNQSYIGSSTSVVITLRNAANNGSVLTLNSVPTISVNAALSISTTCDLSSNLSYNGTCTTTVTFTPTSTSTVSGTITFDTNAGVYTVPVSATGLQSSSTLTAVTSTDFGNVLVNTNATRTFNYTNTGNVQLSNAYVVLSGPSDMTLIPNDGNGGGNQIGTAGNPGTISTGATNRFQVKYAPLAEETVSATATVYSSSADSPQTITLTGAGVNPDWVLQFDDGNGSTTMTDSGNQGGSWSSVNGAACSSTIVYSGASSLHLNGSNQAVTGPSINLNANFFIEFYFYPTSNGGGSVVPVLAMWKQVSGQGGWSISLRGGTNRQMGFSYGALSEAAPVFTTGNSFYTLNAWNHVTLKRQGSAVTLTCNSNTISGSVSGTRTLSVPVSIGNFYNSSGALGGTGTAWYQGYIDQLSISAAQ